MTESLQWILVVFWDQMGMESEKLQEEGFFFNHICEYWVAEIKGNNVINFPHLLDTQHIACVGPWLG